MEDRVSEEANDVPQTGATAESQIIGAPGAEAREPAPIYYDIAIFCHLRNVSILVQAFEHEIKHAAGELPLFVLWSGVTGVLHQGMIILECEGKPPAAFLHNLSIDHEIFDYAVYDWARSEDTQESDREKEEQDAQSQASNKAAGRSFV